MNGDLETIYNLFYKHLLGRGLSEAYSFSLAVDWKTMARKIGPFLTAEEMREYYDGMVTHTTASAPSHVQHRMQPFSCGSTGRMSMLSRSLMRIPYESQRMDQPFSWHSSL